MERRGARMLTTLALIAAEACSQVSPKADADPTATATSTATPTPVLPTETPFSTPSYLQVEVGNGNLKPIEANQDLKKFVFKFESCLETENPDNDCTDPTDKPLKDVPLGIGYEKVNRRSDIKTDDNGFASDTQPMDDVITFSDPEPDGSYWESFRIKMTDVPQEIQIQGADGKTIIACQGTSFLDLDQGGWLYTVPFKSGRCKFSDEHEAKIPENSSNKG